NEFPRGHFDRHRPAEARIGTEVHFTHSAFADHGQNFVIAKLFTGGQSHRPPVFSLESFPSERLADHNLVRRNSVIKFARGFFHPLIPTSDHADWIFRA